MTTQKTNPKIDAYLSIGCMRCKLGGTPNCKVHSWQEELKKLRAILFDCGLTEELKWSQPCYTYQKRNVLIMAAFKDYCALNFFKGSLLKAVFVNFVVFYNGLHIKRDASASLGSNGVLRFIFFYIFFII